MKAKYGLFDWSGRDDKGEPLWYASWSLQFSVNIKTGKPLTTEAEALEALKDFPERPEMRVGKL